MFKMEGVWSVDLLTVEMMNYVLNYNYVFTIMKNVTPVYINPQGLVPPSNQDGTPLYPHIPDLHPSTVWAYL